MIKTNKTDVDASSDSEVQLDPPSPSTSENTLPSQASSELVQSDYWEDLIYYHTQKSFHSALLEHVDHAKSSIYVEFYIFAFDETSLRFLAALRAAKQRGVYVKVLVDGVGSQSTVDALDRYCNAAQIDFRVYRPLPWTIRFFRKLPRPMWFRIGSWLRKLNRRNHRKMVLIDETTAFIGSFNMVQNNWRDSAVHVCGPGVLSFVAAHKLAWFKSRRLGFFRRKKLRTLRQQLRLVSPYVRINSTQQLRSRFYRDFIRRIQIAQSRIFLVTPYFLPKRSLVRALKNAAARGVDVRIILPSKSDIQILRWVAFFFIRVLEKKGVQFFEYQPTILHAKYYIIDNWATLGSHNLNHRSFLHDLESEVIIEGTRDFDPLLQQFFLDLKESKSISSAYKGTLSYLIGRLVFALRYWL